MNSQDRFKILQSLFALRDQLPDETRAQVLGALRLTNTLWPTLTEYQKNILVAELERILTDQPISIDKNSIM